MLMVIPEYNLSMGTAARRDPSNPRACMKNKEDSVTATLIISLIGLMMGYSPFFIFLIHRGC